jgi:hypothetical protein
MTKAFRSVIAQDGKTILAHPSYIFSAQTGKVPIGRLLFFEINQLFVGFLFLSLKGCYYYRKMSLNSSS